MKEVIKLAILKKYVVYQKDILVLDAMNINIEEIH